MKKEVWEHSPDFEKEKSILYPVLMYWLAGEGWGSEWKKERKKSSDSYHKMNKERRVNALASALSHLIFITA